MSKDYIIFNSAPRLDFTCRTPFIESSSSFNSWQSWYNAQRLREPRSEVPGTVSTSNCDSNFILQNISATIRVRGNYTSMYNKKPFRLTLSTPQNLFGLNHGHAATNWILLADYGDNSMLRNALALYMGQQILRGHWAATFTFVQIYIDNEYQGLYLLCDEKEIDEHRINLPEPEAGYTGVDIGYYIERDDYYNQEPNNFVIKYPTEYYPDVLPVIGHETDSSHGVDAPELDGYTIHNKVYSQDQKDFAKKYFQLTYTILYEACVNQAYYEISSSNIADWQSWTLVPSSSNNPVEVVSKVIDLDSFIDMILICEAVGDPDLAHSSFYFSLDMSPTGNKKLALTCPWDHDRTFGLCNGLKNAGQTTLWCKDCHYNPWVSVLPQADWFITLLKARYQQLEQADIFNKCLNMLDDYSDTYVDDFALNFSRWNIRWAFDLTEVNPVNIGSIRTSFYDSITTEAEAKQLLKSWVSTRFNAIKLTLNGFKLEEHLTAPILTFTFNEPFTCEDNLYDNFEDWYSLTEKDTPHPRADGKLSTSNCDSKFILHDVKADVKIRGNYTAFYSKKAFQIRFNKKQNLFGLNNGQKNKKWVLLAEYCDNSMLRNALSFFMAKQICDHQWVPTFKFVHLYIEAGGKSYYQGLYLLCDNKEQNPERVNVFEPEDGYAGTDIGYFFERDDYFRTETDPTFFIQENEYLPQRPGYISTKPNTWSRQDGGTRLDGDGYTIKSTITSPMQVSFLKERMKKIYRIMYEAVHNQRYYELDDNNNLSFSTSTNPIEVLGKIINIDSFVETFILQEIVCNPDVGHSSFHFSLDMSETGDKKLTLTAPWDFDLAMGTVPFFVEDPVNSPSYIQDCTLNPWVNMLPNAEWFRNLVKQKWQALWESAFCRKCINMLEKYSNDLLYDFEFNFREWDIGWAWNANKTWNLEPKPLIIMGIAYVTGVHPITNIRSIHWSMATEVDAKDFLVDWLTARFWSLNSIFEGQSNSFVEPLPDPIPSRPGPYMCVKRPNGYLLKRVHIFGAGNIRTILGNNISAQNAEQILYRLRDQTFKTYFRLDLETGGERISEFNGYTNWFPGCTTYGFVRYNDADIYNKVVIDNETHYVKSGNAVLHYSQGQAKENSTVEILEALDGIDMNLTLRGRLQPMWHIRTNNGIEGYINANVVSDVFYKVKNS